MGHNDVTFRSSQVPLYPENNQNTQIVSDWVADKSDSLLSKMWGYQVQTRIILLPKEIQIQEVASSRFERAWHEIYSKLSTLLWDKKPEFTVSTFANVVIPAELSKEQTDQLKNILEKENLAADSMNEGAALQVFGRVQSLLKSVEASAAKPVQLSDQDYEKSVNIIKTGLPYNCETGEQQWEASKKAIQELAEDYFKNDSGSFLYQHADSILSLIDSILNNKAFLTDPKVYMAAWAEKRGSTEEYRIPEDPARYFLNKLF